MEERTEYMKDREWGISGSTLKMIALITMLIDHIGAVVVARAMYTPGFDQSFWNSIYLPMRQIGRIAFPIYCFLLVEGFLHTKNIKKYVMRMFLFAIISEIPFNLALTGNIFDLRYQNVYWELALGLISICILRFLERKPYPYWLQVFGRLTTVMVFVFLAEGLQLDYGAYGILSIAVLYVCRQNKGTQLAAGALSFLWEVPAPLAFLPIACYNGKRGKSGKYVFYAFYPAHLLILYVAAKVIGCL